MRILPILLLTSAALAQDKLSILAHDLTITIDPATGRFQSVDRVRVRGRGRPELGLLEGIKAEATRDGDELVVHYKGRIAHPAQESEAATWVAGDRTPGTISEAGSYLVRGFFVPSSEPCPFRITIRVPPPHRAVSAGRRVTERDGEVTYETSYPVDGIVVVTGPWRTKEREIDGVLCRTYLYEEDRGHAKLLLDSLAVEIPRYQKLFGAVPDKRFDVVENFFASGYGFSNFALLGDSVIRYVCGQAARRGRTTLPAGYLDHELVHCWLGNFLHVDETRGNWCEALTTYFSNYGAARREKRDAAYRRKVARDYSLRVGAENDYPLLRFKEKRHDFENDIGYGKGSMVFHMLARELGRERLIGAVRHAIETRGGRALGWSDLVQALGEGAGRDLGAWFDPWLTRTGAPILRLSTCRVDGSRIVGTIAQEQEGEPYLLRVPVRVTTQRGVEEHLVSCASKESVFALQTRAKPKRVELDPDHQIFRRTPRARIEPCLQAVLTASKRVGFGNRALLERVAVPVVAPSLPADAAVFAIGFAPAIRSELLAGARRQDPTLNVEQGRFGFRGKIYDQPGDGILFSFRRPRAPKFPVTFFYGNSDAAYARVNYLPYYASHGWVVFRAGRPVERGEFKDDRRMSAVLTATREGKPDSLLGDLLWLTDKAHKGRRAGTMAAYNLANNLRGRLYRTGLRVVPWPAVAIASGSCSRQRTITLLDGEKATQLEGSFYPFHSSGSPAMAAVFERVVEHPAREVKDALVLLPEDAARDLARAYEKRGASVVAVVSKDAAFTARGREAAWVDALPPSVAEHLRRRGIKDIPRAISSLLARTAGPVWERPFLYLGPDAAAALRKHGKRGVVRFRLRRTQESTSNIVGFLGRERKPGILLSAHWDGVGEIDGEAAAGAADNAAGVAVVLWVAEQLKRDFDAGRLKRPVVVALFGGEELGLWGSRQFVRAVLTPDSPVAKPAAAVNVDGIGSGKGDEVYLIGRSHHAGLLAAFQTALRKSWLKLAKDIDRFAYEEGSDHWPLHQAGVPAVTVYNANYRSMNGLGDRLDRVNVKTVRETARVVYVMVRDLAMR